MRRFLGIPKSRSLEEFISSHTQSSGKTWRESDPFSTYRQIYIFELCYIWLGIQCVSLQGRFVRRRLALEIHHRLLRCGRASEILRKGNFPIGIPGTHWCFSWNISNNIWCLFFKVFKTESELRGDEEEGAKKKWLTRCPNFTTCVFPVYSRKMFQTNCFHIPK